jgi:hypothetical protein
MFVDAPQNFWWFIAPILLFAPFFIWIAIRSPKEDSAILTWIGAPLIILGG